jgi:hypothetical protein
MATKSKITAARLVPLGDDGDETALDPRAFDVELAFDTGVAARLHVSIPVRREAVAYLGQVLGEARKLGRDGRPSVRAAS